MLFTNLIVMSVLAESISNQLVKALEMTKDAIENVPDSRWHEGHEKWFFSLTSYHIVETLDFYLNSNSEEDRKNFLWGNRAGYSWSKETIIEKDVLPKITKEVVLDYITEMEGSSSSFLKSLSDDDLLAKDGFHWFSCILEKLQYALRHSAQHCGELSMVLRTWDSPHVKWK